MMIMLLLLLLIISCRAMHRLCGAVFRRGDNTVGNPHRAQFLSLRARAYPPVEIRQTVPSRGIRGNGISVSSTLPRSYHRRLGRSLRLARVFGAILRHCRRGDFKRKESLREGDGLGSYGGYTVSGRCLESSCLAALSPWRFQEKGEGEISKGCYKKGRQSKKHQHAAASGFDTCGSFLLQHPSCRRPFWSPLIDRLARYC